MQSLTTHATLLKLTGYIMKNIQKLVDRGGRVTFTMVNNPMREVTLNDVEKERMAATITTLVEYLRKIEYVYDDGPHEFVALALREADRVAGAVRE